MGVEQWPLGKSLRRHGSVGYNCLSLQGEALCRYSKKSQIYITIA